MNKVAEGEGVISGRGSKRVGCSQNVHRATGRSIGRTGNMRGRGGEGEGC